MYLFSLNNTITAHKERSNPPKFKINSYYIREAVAQQCIQHIKDHIFISPTNDIIIHPNIIETTCIPYIRQLCQTQKFYTTSYHVSAQRGIVHYDFLQLNPTPFSNYNKIHLVVIPPLGCQSTIIIKYIKKACSFCDTMSLILPRVFKKTTMYKYFAIQFHLEVEIELPNNSLFCQQHKPQNIPTILQIWSKRAYPREEIKIPIPQKFSFVNKYNTPPPDISFQRVGKSMSKISCEFSNKSENTHYFISFHNGKSVTENIDIISKIHFSRNNTSNSSSPSISKPELTNEFNNVL